MSLCCMNREKNLLVLWIIFGFVFISAIDAILHFLIHMIYFGFATLGISYKILTFLLPCITAALYLFTTFFLIYKLKYKNLRSKMFSNNFPGKTILYLGLVALFFPLLTNKLAGLFTEYSVNLSSINTSGFLNFFGWFQLGFNISRWLVLIVLVIVYLTKLKNDSLNEIN